MSDAASKPINPQDTRQRLLDAASRVFGRCGLDGATTREIAREANVNEVTLFRHFKTKEKLLAEVVRRTFDRQEEALASQPPAGDAADLRAVLRRYAQRYHELLERNLPLLRTLIGEIHRYKEHQFRVCKGVFAPLKAELHAALQTAQARGAMRTDIEARVAADIFGSMIFTEVFRRASPYCPDYPTADYLATCVDVFVRGIEN